MINAFKKFKSQTPDLDKVQENVDNVVKQLQVIELLGAIELREVELKTGQDNNIEHKLNRKINNFIVCRKNANADVWEEETLFPSKFLNLHTTADCKVNLIIY